MTVIAQLQEASFKGFSFLVYNERASAGKKVVVHEYPNSNKRYAEELGRIPPSFTIDAIVHGSINSRLRFEQLLNEAGIGTLVHPVYGTINVMAGSFTVSSNQTRIGEFIFAITFFTTETNISPSVEETSKTQITTGVNAVQSYLGIVFEETYIEPTFVDSFNDAAEKVTAFLNDIQDLAKGLSDTVAENVSSFNAAINAALDTVFTIVGSASSLRETFETVFDALSNTVDTVSDLTGVFEALSFFGSDDTAKTNTTVKQQEIVNNRSTINDYIQIQSLAYLYETIVFTNFQTDVELIAAQEDLSEDYQRIFLNRVAFVDAPENYLLVLDPDVRTNMQALRNNAKKLLNNALQNVWRIVTIKPQHSSIALTLYRYYGDLDNLDLLSNLNPEINNAFFKDDIKAVTR